MLVFVIFGVIDHRAVPGWAPMAIGAIVFAIIIILGPATGAAINPARYLGAVFMLKAFGGKVLWSQVPAYLIGELAGGVLGGLAWAGIGRVRADAAMTSLAPSEPVPAAVDRENPGRHVMKKLINSPDTVVTDALAGVAAAHPSLAVDIENKVITRAGGPQAGKVGLVSGGGSGHEPLHGGFVGYGMLDAACPGEVFTSPVPDQMLAATKAVNGGAGVLHIVKNYTGDVLNFQMAAELADDEGIEVVVGGDQRRRRGAGLALHRGAAGRRRHRLRGEDRRRARRGGSGPGQGRRPWRVRSTSGPGPSGWR